MQATIWDTAGQERFRSLTSTYYMNSDAAIFMFDVENRESFDSIQFWREDVSNYVANNDEFVWAIAGNKCDLHCQIPNEYITDLCQQIETELMFFTSAKTGENVKETFEAVIREVHKKSLAKEATGADNPNFEVRLTLTNEERRFRCCTCTCSRNT